MYKTLSEDKENFNSYKKSQQFMLQRVSLYLAPFIARLNTEIDKRLVRTFYDAFVSILLFVNRDKGLLLSELGKYICGPEHAPAGTKRLSNLFRCKKWSSEDIELVQINRAKSYIESAQKEGKRVLAFWDDSMVEKPESWHSEGLCSVYSSKASRLTRIKAGYYNKPKGRICVPGFEWSAMMIGGLRLTPMLGLMRWWTTKGKHKELRSNIFYRMLKQVFESFGSVLTNVLDRGYANIDNLERLLKFHQTFIIRWKSNQLLSNEQGVIKNTWRLCHQKKGMDSRVVYDKERKKTMRLEIHYQAVKHPELPDNQLFLVVIRNKSYQYRTPMYLLTNLFIDTIGMAWEVFFSYIHRWDVEQAFRFNKSELGIQSARLWEFKNRQKMMALVTLIYDFLLQMWRNWETLARLWIKKWCPRTGKRLTNIRLPLYRLREAISIALILVWAKNSG